MMIPAGNSRYGDERYNRNLSGSALRKAHSNSAIGSRNPTHALVSANGVGPDLLEQYSDRSKC